jgi:hypothetical protein
MNWANPKGCQPFQERFLTHPWAFDWGFPRQNKGFEQVPRRAIDATVSNHPEGS